MRPSSGDDASAFAGDCLEPVPCFKQRLVILARCAEPEALPAGWATATDANGRTYFW
jgi:hypothetical protein